MSVFNTVNIYLLHISVIQDSFVCNLASISAVSLDVYILLENALLSCAYVCLAVEICITEYLNDNYIFDLVFV